MSALRDDQDNPIIAILCSDIHLSEKPPLARFAEPDWFAAMKRPLKEIEDLATPSAVRGGSIKRTPVVCAGDIFDKWNPSPRLINWALDNLPEMWAIPGQHDLRYHSYEDIEHTAYHTLCCAGKIQDIDPTCSNPVGGEYDLVLWGFPWGRPVEPNIGKRYEGELHLAVVHAYIWLQRKDAFPGAPEDRQVSCYADALMGYDAAVFGDNHKGWTTRGSSATGGVVVHNNGTLIRRKVDEISYRPQVGLLHASGQVTPYRLDTSQDKFADEDVLAGILKDTRSGLDAGEFVNDLHQLGEVGIDFFDAVMQTLRKYDLAVGVRRRILEALGETK